MHRSCDEKRKTPLACTHVLTEMPLPMHRQHASMQLHVMHRLLLMPACKHTESPRYNACAMWCLAVHAGAP